MVGRAVNSRWSHGIGEFDSESVTREPHKQNGRAKGIFSYDSTIVKNRPNTAKARFTKKPNCRELELRRVAKGRQKGRPLSRDRL